MISVLSFEFFFVETLGGCQHSTLALELDLVKAKELGHFKGCNDVLMHESCLRYPVNDLVYFLKEVIVKEQISQF